MTTKKKVPRISANIAESSLIYIGDNHYVDPATGMILSRIGHINAHGYEKIEHDGQKAVSVHRLVFEAVKGPMPDGLVVNHINSDRSDNRPENLEAVTHVDNMWHMRAMDRHPTVKPTARGEKHPKAKLTDAQVEEMRKRFTKGESVPKLAAEYGVSRSHAYKLVNQRHGGRAQYGQNRNRPTRPRDKTTPEQRREIARRIGAGEYAPKVAEEFGISAVNAYVIAREVNGPRREFRKVTPEQRLEMARRKGAGEKSKDLAEEYGITPRHVAKIAREVAGLASS
ncbi:HNH endonuclease [Streptomyces sp. ND04-05B]|uniref:HNH endonuclease n=1 Tax=Streptomyces sp. ND04-05B TaxID=3028693 RepID=UPI0029BD2EB2|nr:HNH endonuclease [Streptomyces sp. ND04-05B]MDX3067154.1 HNH endonuclease [Streptomyces sp. ND04-05B]